MKNKKKMKSVFGIGVLAVAAVLVITFLVLNGNIAKHSPVMAEVYVSADGSDAGDGSKGSPFATIERARDEVRKINTDMNGDIIVHIADGEYTLADTLQLGEQDGGTNGYAIRYVGDKNTVISGGAKLEGFEIYDEENGIYSAKVPAGTTFRQLYVNGEKMILSDTEHGYKHRIVGASRFTADGTLIPEWNNNGAEETLAQADYGEIYVPTAELPAFKDPKGAEIHIFAAWTKSILRIDSIEHGDRETSTIRVQEPEGKLIFNRMHPDIDGYSHMNTHAFAYYLQNAYELIDWYGEWYLDQKTNTLYIKAPENTDMTTAEVIYPRLETLVKLESESGKKIQNISFEKLTFAHSNWTVPGEQGFVEVQAGMYANRCVFATNDMSVSRPTAGIYAANTENFTVKNCTVEKMGAAGIDLNHGTLNSRIIGNTIRNISGNGIMVGSFVVDENTDIHTVYNPADESEICTGDQIVNNLVTQIGTDYEGSVGIVAGYPRDILIACNEVSEAPYTGISVGYGWSDADNAMRHNRILHNEIYHTSRMLCDAGGIYTLSRQPDSEMRGNYIHDIDLPDGADYATSGIYMDEQTAGYTVKNNVIYHAWGVGRNNNGDNDYQEKKIYIDKKWDPRTWGIMANAGRKHCYQFFAGLHY